MSETTEVIRPAAVLRQQEAELVVEALSALDVAKGGQWNINPGLWQRYDAPWDGVGGTRGDAQLLGSIAVMYDSPHRHEITIYKVTVSENGLDQGWTVESLCDDALIWAGLTIATCPRAELTSPPERGGPWMREHTGQLTVRLHARAGPARALLQYGDAATLENHLAEVRELASR